ncbi:MAG: PPC domain-containing protein [Verrucomicrobiales bacterium]
MRTPITALALALAAYLAAASDSRAADPRLSSIYPRGGQVGTEVQVDFNGDRLEDPEEVLYYGTGISTKEIAFVDPKKVKVTFAIAADCPIGEHSMRLRCKGGISELSTFWVGQFPTVDEAEDNSDFAAPQKIERNVTVHGVANNEDVDYYLVEGVKKGERLSAEVEGIRLGGQLIDPYLAIMDMKRFEIAANDDTALLLQDAYASVIAPEDGSYVIQVRDASYQGNGGYHYRLHVGGFPRPSSVFPAGGKPGEELAIKYIGDPAGEKDGKVKLPDQPGIFPVFADDGGFRSPSPIPVRVNALNNTIEAEPNNSQKEATPAAGELPLAFNGILAEDGDQDWIKFNAKKDQKLEFRAHARSIRSPLDPVINLFAPDGKHLQGNDDDGGSPDSKLVFTIPADGEYALRVRDHLDKGGPNYIYRVEIQPTAPSLEITIPRFERNDSQARQEINVPRGNRFATVFNAARSEFGGDLVFEFPQLPQGVTAKAVPLPGSQTQGVVVFEAAPDAPVAGGLFDMVTRHADANTGISGPFSQNVELVTGPPNNTVFYANTYNKLPAAVVEEAPFKVELVPPWRSRSCRAARWTCSSR